MLRLAGGGRLVYKITMWTDGSAAFWARRAMMGWSRRPRACDVRPQYPASPYQEGREAVRASRRSVLERAYPRNHEDPPSPSKQRRTVPQSA